MICSIRLEISRLRKATSYDLALPGVQGVTSIDVNSAMDFVAVLHEKRVTVYSLPSSTLLESFVVDYELLAIGDTTDVLFHGSGCRNLLLIDTLSVSLYCAGSIIKLIQFDQTHPLISTVSCKSETVFIAFENTPVLHQYEIEHSKLIESKTISIESQHKSDSVLSVTYDNEVLVITCNGPVGPSVVQYGSTQTSVDFLAAIECGYNAIGFISRSMTAKVKLSLKTLHHTAAMKKIKECSEFFKNFLNSRKEKVGSCKSGNGSLVTSTIGCLGKTVTAIEHTLHRLESLNAQNMDKLFLYTLSNECIVERSFGFISVKGGYYNKNPMEYCVSKRKTVIDMICRNTKTLFYTPSMNRKIYQTPIMSSVSARQVLKLY